MKTFIQHTLALAKREYWENKKLVILTSFVIIAIGWLITICDAIQSGHFVLGNTLNQITNTAPYYYAYRISYYYCNSYLFVLWFIIGFYLLHSLHGEKQQNSRLFWLSLPLNPFEDVLSKWMMALIIIPVIFFTVMLINMFVSISFISIQYMIYHHGAFPTWYWNITGVTLSFIQLIHIYLFHVCLLLPILSWLFFCSGVCRSKPIILAISPAIVLMLFDFTTNPKKLWLMNHTLIYIENIFNASLNWGGAITGRDCTSGTICRTYHQIPSLMPHHHSLWSLINTPNLFIFSGLLIATVLFLITHSLRANCIHTE